MKSNNVGRQLSRRLEAAGIPNPAFEAELLVREAAHLDRAAYFAGAQLDIDDTVRLERLVLRRLAREPTPYITGHREFYGLDFTVTPDVLIPRPETELLVDAALAEPTIDRADVVNVGTGSGCVAAAIAVHRPGWRITGVDHSHSAIALAAINGSRHSIRVHWVIGDLLAPFAHADVVVANLPYVPTADIAGLSEEIRRWEPGIALDGGCDGLDLIRRLIDDCARRLRPRLLALEVGWNQADAVSAYAGATGATTTTVDDLAGIPRVVCVRWR